MDKLTFFKHYGIIIWHIVNALLYDEITCHTLSHNIHSLYFNDIQSGNKFYTKMDLVVCIVKNTTHWISNSDEDLMTTLPNPITLFKANVRKKQKH